MGRSGVATLTSARVWPPTQLSELEPEALMLIERYAGNFPPRLRAVLDLQAYIACGVSLSPATGCCRLNYSMAGFMHNGLVYHIA